MRPEIEPFEFRPAPSTHILDAFMAFKAGQGERIHPTETAMLTVAAEGGVWMSLCVTQGLLETVTLQRRESAYETGELLDITEFYDLRSFEGHYSICKKQVNTHNWKTSISKGKLMQLDANFVAGILKKARLMNIGSVSKHEELSSVGNSESLTTRLMNRALPYAAGFAIYGASLGREIGRISNPNGQEPAADVDRRRRYGVSLPMRLWYRLGNWI